MLCIDELKAKHLDSSCHNCSFKYTLAIHGITVGYMWGVHCHQYVFVSADDHDDRTCGVKCLRYSVYSCLELIILLRRLFLMYPMLPFSLAGPFLISPSVLPKVY